MEAAEDVRDESDTECRPMEFAAKGSQRILAMDRQIVIWKEWTRMADFHQEDEWWKAQKAWRLVDEYTGHKTAQPFKAHEKYVNV